MSLGTNMKRGVDTAINIGIALVVAVVSLAAIEFALLWAGYLPYRPAMAASILVEPGGRLYEADSELGYRNLVGRFDVTLPTGWKYSVTNDRSTHRVTRPASAPGHANEAWLFGCSFTYGWGINDKDTFAWKIARGNSDLDIVNFGVPGYGTLQGLIQFRGALASGRTPKFVAIVYASHHDERNASLRFRRKEMAPFVLLGPINHPYARLRFGALVTYTLPFEYALWPFQGSLASVELMENAYSRNEDVVIDSQSITKAILREFLALAQPRSIPVVLFGIRDDKRTRQVIAYAKTIGIIAADVSEDLNGLGAAIAGDGHPTAATNDRYAQKMIAVLREKALY